MPTRAIERQPARNRTTRPHLLCDCLRQDHSLEVLHPGSSTILQCSLERLVETRNQGEFSKQSRSRRRELHKEIFVGFYMRRWASPCLSLKTETERPDMGFFSDSQTFSGFQILCPDQNLRLFLGHAAIDARQAQESTRAAKREWKAGEMLKRHVRKPVHVPSSADRFFDIWRLGHRLYDIFLILK